MNERDVLAAYVEECQPIIEAYANAAFFDSGKEQVKEDAKRLVKQKPIASLSRLKAQWQAEALERLRELLKDTHMEKAPSVSRAAMHVDDAINRVKQECASPSLRCRAKEDS